MDIDLNSLTNEVHSMDTSTTSSCTNKTTFNDCCKTPLLYITIVPIIVCILIYIINPSIMYDVDNITKYKKFNRKKAFQAIIISIILIDVFIYFYLIQHCNYNL